MCCGSSLGLPLMLWMGPGTLLLLISMLAGHLTSSRRMTFKVGLLVSLASWPTSSSTPLRTKIDSIIHSSQSDKNVNKEQKLPVPQISEGLFGNKAFLKPILLRSWPWPFLSTPFSKATAQGSAAQCLRFPYLTLADTGSPHSLDFRLSWSSCGLAAPLSSAWPSSPSTGLKLIDFTPSSLPFLSGANLLNLSIVACVN